MPQFYRELLLTEYRKRQSKNALFSKNSYAKLLGVSPSYFSKMMAGSIPLSLKKAQLIVCKLKLSKEISREFVLSVVDEQRQEALLFLENLDPVCKDVL